MTVPSENSVTTFNTDADDVAFPTGFVFLESSHLKVWHMRTGDARLLKTEGVDYTVTHPTPSGSGTVTFFVAPGAGVLEIERTLPITQGINLRTQGPYTPATLEEMADRLTEIAQQLARRVTSLEAGGGEGGSGWSARADELQAAIDALAMTVGSHTATLNDVAVSINDLATAVSNIIAELSLPSDATPASVGSAGDAGDSANYSRANHVHAHGAQALGDGTNHALATETVAGFASPQLVQRVNATLAEQVHIIDAVTTDSTPTQVLTYTPTDGTIERVAVEAICVDDTGFAGQAGRVGAVDGLSPDAVHIDYTGDGTTVQFDFPWWTDKADGVEVTVNNVAKVYGTDYSVTLPSGATYGHVRLNVAPTLGQAVVISQASAAPLAIVQRTGGSTVVAGAPYVPAIRPGRDFAILIDASSPLVRVRLRGGNYSTRWRVVLKRLTVALAP